MIHGVWPEVPPCFANRSQSPRLMTGSISFRRRVFHCFACQRFALQQRIDRLERVHASGSAAARRCRCDFMNEATALSVVPPANIECDAAMHEQARQRVLQPSHSASDSPAFVHHIAGKALWFPSVLSFSSSTPCDGSIAVRFFSLFRFPKSASARISPVSQAITESTTQAEKTHSHGSSFNR